jgi:hypothetical protein
LIPLFYCQFLRCREAWLNGILEDLDQANPYEYLKGMINCHRLHLFDVVNQYRAIFADDTSGSEENYDGGLLFSWAMHQITSHLQTLKVMLPKITEGGSLSNILDQCMVSFFHHTLRDLENGRNYDFVINEDWDIDIMNYIKTKGQRGSFAINTYFSLEIENTNLVL